MTQQIAHSGSPARRQMPLQTRAGTVNGAVPATRSVNIVWSTGATVKRFDWWSGTAYLEELSLDRAHVRLDRLNNGANVLDTHAQARLQNILGVVERGSASVDGKAGRCRATFSSRPEVDAVWQDIEAGIIGSVSVGYVVHRYEKTDAPEAGGLPTWRAIDWEPHEISLLAVPADAGASIVAATRGASTDPNAVLNAMAQAVGARTFPCEFITRAHSSKGISMEDNTLAPEGQAPTASPPAVAQQIRSLVAFANRVSHGGFAASFGDSLISTGASIDEARSAVFGELARRSDSWGPVRSAAALSEDGAVFPGGHNPHAPEGRVSLYAEVLASRCGGPAPSEQARQFGRLRVSDMARDLLEMRGVHTTTMGSSEIVSRALHTTSDFPNLLQGTGNRVLRKAYGSYTGGIRGACKQSTARDFRAKQNLRLGEAPELEKVNEKGEFKRGTMTESKETYSLSTFGKIFGITRQALVNDDLDAFGTMNVKLGLAAAEFEAKQLVTLLTSNPTMGDGVALFHATHGNLGTAAAISNTSLGEARRAMRLQKGVDGKTPIDVVPAFVIVPAALEMVIDGFLAPVYAPNAVAVNVFATGTGLVTKIVDPRLDAVSTTAWYLAASPAQVDTIEYSYLEDEPGPQITTREGFDVDGLEIRVHLDFGAGVLDWRGLYRNPGL
jgi:Caudovirus prohead serine protease